MYQFACCRDFSMENGFFFLSEKDIFTVINKYVTYFVYAMRFSDVISFRQYFDLIM